MKKLKIALGIAVVAFTMQAQAHLINGTQYLLSSVLGNPADELAWLEAETGNNNLVYLEKESDNNGPYNTYIGASGVGNASASVSWDLTGTGYQVQYVLIKDGNTGGNPQQFLYKLYGVSADQQIVNLIGDSVSFDSPYANKAISHITFFGGVATDPGDPVPDGGATLGLLGLALLGLNRLRQRLA